MPAPAPVVTQEDGGCGCALPTRSGTQAGGFASALLVLLLGTGIFLTMRLRVIQIRKVSHALAIVAGYYDNPKDKGEISHFQALTSALSATIGIGNISGVATAIHYGGPGALFWMWLTAFFGMALKYTECTLAMKFRTILPGGSAAGGPMYSIERGLGPRWKPLGIAFACFAVISSFGSGNAVQSFTVADQFRQDLGVPTWVTGLVAATPPETRLAIASCTALAMSPAGVLAWIKLTTSDSANTVH